MRYWLSFLMLLGLAQGQTFVACAEHQTLTSTADTVTVSIAAGHLAVVLVHQDANSTSTVTITDSTAGANTWTQSSSGYSARSGINRVAIFYSLLASPVTSITSTWTGALSTNVNTTAMDWSGTATSSIEDSTSVINNATTSTTSTSAALTTANANDTLIFGTGAGGPFTAPAAGSGFTLPTNCGNGRNVMTYEIVAATQSALTTTQTWTTGQAWANIFMAIKKAPAGAGKCASCDLSELRMPTGEIQ